MSFFLTLILLVAMGWAVVRLLGLGTGNRVADLAVAWLVGSGVYAIVETIVRLVLHVPSSRAVVLAITLVPVAGWLFVRSRRGPIAGATRWLPRPLALFVPLVLFVVITAGVTVIHGIATPTHTADGMAVRALTALVAAEDVWPDAYVGLMVTSGPVPTFVPALGARLTGVVDHFQSNYVVLADLVALLLLCVGIAARRERPERGWVSAFLLLSLPLFVYHCTSTYSDATLAIRIGAAVVFLLELEDTGDVADARRGLLLLAMAALVKREGDFVAAPVAAVLLFVALRRCKQPRLQLASRLGVCLVPYLVYAATKVSLVHVVEAFPFLSPLVNRAAAALPTAPETAVASAVAGNQAGVPQLFLYALTQSGNANVLFYVFPVAIIVGVRAWWSRRSGSLLAVLAMFAEAMIIALWVYPRFTRDQTTVHRALLPVSVSAMLWLAALVGDAVWPADQGGAERAASKVRA